MNNEDLTLIEVGNHLHNHVTGKTTEVRYVDPHDGETSTLITAPADVPTFIESASTTYEVGKTVEIESEEYLVLECYLYGPQEAVLLLTADMDADPEDAYIITMHNARRWNRV